MVDGSKREDHLHLHLLDLQLTLLLFVTLDAHHALSWPGNVCLASSCFHWLAHSSFPMDKHNIEVLCWHGCSVTSQRFLVYPFYRTSLPHSKCKASKGCAQKCRI